MHCIISNRINILFKNVCLKLTQFVKTTNNNQKDIKEKIYNSMKISALY